MYDLVVVGAGAAGMMAAGSAAERGKNVLVIEKNERAGKKLLITGKGRCNLTNDCDVEEIIDNFPGNGKFLYSSLYSFTNWQLREFFADLGVKTKVERGGRVFPTTNDASDVVSALEDYLLDNGVTLNKNEKVEDVLVENKSVKTVVTDKDSYDTKSVLITTGGLSYPSTGSSGDGYKLAKKLGHKVVKPQPSLVPLEAGQNWVSRLQGLNLKNVVAEIYIDGELKKSEFGEMIFTHYGVSGPIILTLSREIIGVYKGEIKLKIDLKPALDLQKLDERIQRDFEKYSRKFFRNSLDDLLPRKLIPEVIELVDIPDDKEVNQITAQERRSLAQLLKGLEIKVIKDRGFREAIVTAGGVETDQIDASSMESKLVSGLYFAGEVIDIDGYTGGFNLQAAFSTGRKAGLNV